jgi:hypothetical protein
LELHHFWEKVVIKKRCVFGDTPDTPPGTGASI